MTYFLYNLYNLLTELAHNQTDHQTPSVDSAINDKFWQLVKQLKCTSFFASEFTVNELHMTMCSNIHFPMDLTNIIYSYDVPILETLHQRLLKEPTAF